MPLVVLDGNLVSRNLKTSTDGSDLVVHHNVDTVANAVAATQSGGWTVSITGTVPAVTPGTGSTNLGKADDAAHTTGDVGVMSLAVRNDAGTALAGTTGDYIPFSTDAVGNLRTTDTLNGDGIGVAGTSLVVKNFGAFVNSSQTDSVLVAAVTAKKIRVVAVYVNGDDKTGHWNFNFRTKPAGAGTKISTEFAGDPRASVVLPLNPYGWFETSSGQGLAVSTGADSGVNIQLCYMEV